MNRDDEWMMSPDMSLTDRSAALPKTLIREEWLINPVIVILGQRLTRATTSGFSVLACDRGRLLYCCCH